MENKDTYIKEENMFVFKDDYREMQYENRCLREQHLKEEAQIDYLLAVVDRYQKALERACEVLTENFGDTVTEWVDWCLEEADNYNSAEH